MPGIQCIALVIFASITISGCLAPDSPGDRDSQMMFAPGTYAYTSTSEDGTEFQLKVTNHGGLSLVMSLPDEDVNHTYNQAGGVLRHSLTAELNPNQSGSEHVMLIGPAAGYGSLDAAIALWLALSHETPNENGARISKDATGWTLHDYKADIEFRFQVGRGVFPPSSITATNVSTGQSSSWTRQSGLGSETVRLGTAPPLWNAGNETWSRVPQTNLGALLGREVQDVVNDAMRHPAAALFVQEHPSWYVDEVSAVIDVSRQWWTIVFQDGCAYFEITVLYHADLIGVPTTATESNQCRPDDVAWQDEGLPIIPNLIMTMQRFDDVWGDQGDLRRLTYAAPTATGSASPAGSWTLQKEVQVQGQQVLASFSPFAPNDGRGIATAQVP